jgi:hypothetical protein
MSVRYVRNVCKWGVACAWGGITGFATQLLVLGVGSVMRHPLIIICEAPGEVELEICIECM